MGSLELFFAQALSEANDGEYLQKFTYTLGIIFIKSTQLRYCTRLAVDIRLRALP
jgi:hypothetical protein